MNRRIFLRVSTGTILLGALGPFNKNTFSVPEDSPSIPDYLFFDERFSEAVQYSLEYPKPGEILSVRGDITQVWISELKERCQAGSLLLVGMTTESFHFCLDRLLRSHVNVESSIKQVNRDLYTWTIHTNYRKTV